MLLETHLKLCVTELDFMEETFLLPKMGKWNKNGQKTGIFEYIEKCHYVLLNFNYMKIYIICFGPAQIPYLVKFLFLK